MTEKTLEELFEEMLLETDQLALETFEPGTPIFNFQQSMIKNAAQFRLSKAMHERHNKKT
jgi:hypothetical protein